MRYDNNRDISKSCSFQNEIISDGYVLRQYKVCDGRIRYTGITIDPNYDKEDFEVIESLDCYGLQYDDMTSNYELKYRDDCNFSNESDL